MEKREMKRIILAASIMLVSVLAVQAANNTIDDDVYSINFLQTNTFKSDPISFLIQESNNELIDIDKYLTIKFINNNLSHSSRVYWNLSREISNYTERNDLIDKYEISIIAKGERGDEWIDLDFYSSGNIVNSIPFHLTDEWKEIKYYVYDLRGIDAIGLAFSPYKNPVGATVFIRMIEARPITIIQELNSTRTSKYILLRSNKSKLNIKFEF